ncbi:SGNH/GDSL hydrolase family protein [Nocardia concava]|uniref:SGNH/GDSL hydrolase family protein n=1 Tax=Nocardia concava TaxID=257281 RepID=UPI0002E7334B|nr:SGNH/GDSL hydrolase family protein [Nocardia concava]
MPTAIQNLIVLGDSLSDIGNKRETPAGMFARAAGLMRTNEAGRYSDGKNWTDFLVEWMGGEPLIRGDLKQTDYATLPHRSLSKDSLVLRTDFGDLAPVRYANFAEGGAIASSDWPKRPKEGALGFLKEQVDRYIRHRREMGAAYTGETLHIIWIGLNDIVTAKRPDGMDLDAQAATTHDPVTKVPDVNTAGTGVAPIVAEINAEVNRIADEFGPAHEHFILIDLPDPRVSVRFQERIADKGEGVAAKEVRMVARFNELLALLTAHWPATESQTPAVSFSAEKKAAKANEGHRVPDGPKSSFGAAEVTPIGGADPAKITLVRMSDWMRVVGEKPDVFRLKPLPQRHGPVRYLGAQEPMPDPELRRALTTSDLAHPTEAVYELIGRQIVDTALAKGYRIGRLTTESWPDQRPFRGIPGL